MKMEFTRKLSDKVYSHIYSLISMVNCPINLASRKIEEKLCRNVLKNVYVEKEFYLRDTYKNTVQ